MCNYIFVSSCSPTRQTQSSSMKRMRLLFPSACKIKILGWLTFWKRSFLLIETQSCLYNLILTYGEKIIKRLSFKFVIKIHPQKKLWTQLCKMVTHLLHYSCRQPWAATNHTWVVLEQESQKYSRIISKQVNSRRKINLALASISKLTFLSWRRWLASYQMKKLWITKTRDNQINMAMEALATATKFNWTRPTKKR